MRGHGAAVRTMAVLTIVGLVFAACGADSEDAQSGQSESTTTTQPQADDATTALAIAATARIEDFGPGWKLYRDGETNTLDGKSCAHRVDGPEAKLATGAAYVGPVAELEGKSTWVTTRSYVFPTEADAIAWVDIAESPEWASCRQSQLEEAYNKEADSEVTVENTTAQAKSRPNLEAYTEFQGTNEAGEVVTQTASAAQQQGRVVSVIAVESLDGMTDADWTTLQDNHQAAFDAMWARVEALA